MQITKCDKDGCGRELRQGEKTFTLSIKEKQQTQGLGAVFGTAPGERFTLCRNCEADLQDWIYGRDRKRVK